MISAILCGIAIIPSWTVCIDPGHPSENGVGTKGKTVTEVELVWDLSLKTKEFLKREGVKVVLTKSKEKEKVTNRRRAEIANESKADLVIRMHADAGSHSGFGTFYPDRAAKIDGHTGPSKEVLKYSAIAAKAFHSKTISTLDVFLKDAGLKTERSTAIGAKQGALTGSVYSTRPVFLVEACVLTNKSDEEKMSTREGRLKVAQSMTKGILAALEALEKAR